MTVDMVWFIDDGFILGKAGVRNKLKENLSHRVVLKGFMPYLIIRDVRANDTIHKGRG